MSIGRRSVTILAAAMAVPIALAGAGKADAAERVFTGAQAAASTGVWGTAVDIPGTNAFPQAPGSGWVTSVSCAEPGDCSVGGAYPDSQGFDHAFVASEVNGAWSQAVDILGAGRAGYPTSVNSVSCAKPGDCSAGGYYQDSAGNNQAFVASEVNGAWSQAIEVPGTAALNAHQNGSVNSVACTSPGNCSAGGSYSDLNSMRQAFVANEVNGTWQTAIEVPGTAALNLGGTASVASVSCTKPGDCSAGGFYSDVYGQNQAFVVDEVNGTWSQAIEVPGTAVLNQGDYGGVTSVSCASPGNCSAGGHYSHGSFPAAFVANEVNGTWQTAIPVPGTGTGTSNVNSVSCASPGNCSAGGYFGPNAFVVNEVNGTWQTVLQVTGIPAQSVESVSCAAAGRCSAGGDYSLPPLGEYGRTFVVSAT